MPTLPICSSSRMPACRRISATIGSRTLAEDTIRACPSSAMLDTCMRCAGPPPLRLIRAASAGGPPQQVFNGLMHRAQRRDAVQQQPNHHRIARPTSNEVLGAVDRVNEPGAASASTRTIIGNLFAQDGIGGKACLSSAMQKSLTARSAAVTGSSASLKSI